MAILVSFSQLEWKIIWNSLEHSFVGVLVIWKYCSMIIRQDALSSLKKKGVKKRDMAIDIVPTVLPTTNIKWKHEWVESLPGCWKLGGIAMSKFSKHNDGLLTDMVAKRKASFDLILFYFTLYCSLFSHLCVGSACLLDQKVYLITCL